MKDYFRKSIARITTFKRGLGGKNPFRFFAIIISNGLLILKDTGLDTEVEVNYGEGQHHSYGSQSYNF